MLAGEEPQASPPPRAGSALYPDIATMNKGLAPETVTYDNSVMSSDLVLNRTAPSDVVYGPASSAAPTGMTPRAAASIASVFTEATFHRQYPGMRAFELRASNGTLVQVCRRRAQEIALNQRDISDDWSTD